MFLPMGHKDCKACTQCSVSPTKAPSFGPRGTSAHNVYTTYGGLSKDHSLDHLSSIRDETVAQVHATPHQIAFQRTSEELIEASADGVRCYLVVQREAPKDTHKHLIRQSQHARSLWLTTSCHHAYRFAISAIHVDTTV